MTIAADAFRRSRQLPAAPEGTKRTVHGALSRESDEREFDNNEYLPHDLADQ
jgi:hypothetical protein